MVKSRLFVTIVALAAVTLGGSGDVAAGAESPAWRSHPPARPLPRPSQRPASETGLYVDPVKGDDSADGGIASPWKTVDAALGRLQPGQTLFLRGGTYHQTIRCAAVGRPEEPITIRSAPGELAIIDGGLREFLEEPSTAWEPFNEGGAGEYVSARVYPGLGDGESRRGVAVTGNFGDSMVPLHGYHTAIDLRSDSMFSFAGQKEKQRTQGFYAGPGVWWNPQTGRIHCRLAHCNLEALGEDRYRGETDPRKLPLVVAAGSTPVLTLDGARHVRFQDLVFRGAKGPTVRIAGSQDIELDGVEIFGGSPAVRVSSTGGLRVVNSAVRGLAAPWSSRSSMKYFGNSPYLVMVDKSEPLSRDFEFAFSEFTDSHDGLYIGTVDGLDMHHCFVDNHNDDGIYVTAVVPEAGNLRIWQNRISRCLSTFSFYGSYPPFQLGRGVYISRNVIDLRPVVHYQWPSRAGEAITSRGRVWGEHGGPVWEPLYFYHNTVMGQDNYYGGYYAMGWAGHISAKAPRRVFNNIFLVVEKNPGIAFPQGDGFDPTAADLQVDGNLFWSPREGPRVNGDYFAAFRKSRFFEASRQRYEPGWTAHDRFADPGFIQFHEEFRRVSDLRLQENSPAIDAGVDIPGHWHDPLRGQDQGRPDIGALPCGARPDGVGISGRIPIFGGVPQ